MRKSNDPDIRLKIAVFDVLFQVDVEQLGMQRTSVEEKIQIRTSLLCNAQFQLDCPCFQGVLGPCSCLCYERIAQTGHYI